MESMERQFLAVSAQTLRDNYLPKVKEAVALLSDAEIWARQSESSNSIGNLLMHLSGNVRQHVIAGIGGRPDERDRPKEFSARGGTSRAALVNDLEKTVLEAYHIIATLDPTLLSEERVIQGNKVTLLKDIYHVVEHFAYHSGQIIFFVKALKHYSFPWYAHLDQPAKV